MPRRFNYVPMFVGPKPDSLKVDRREQVTSVVSRERNAADVVLELAVPDREASTQRLELGDLGQACFKERLQVLIVGVHDIIRRHGDKTPADRMHPQTVEVACKADDLARFAETQEHVLVKTLVAKFAVEALDERVPHWLAGRI